MKYNTYKEILDQHLIIDDVTSFVKSLVKDSTSFKRITTSFNIKSFEERLSGSYLTSISIKLGDALEDAFKEYLKEKGAIFLARDFVPHKDCDQIFQYNDIIFLIEQKIRDDHDSSKKIGQIENYNNKKNIIASKVDKYFSCCWFIDPDFVKNKNYYISILNKDELYYGAEIENFLKDKVFHDDRCNGFFEEFLTYIEKYTNEFSIFDISNLTINYKDFSVTELYRLLNTTRHIDKVATIFFNGTIPFKEIYDYVEKSRSVPCKENFKTLLKEYIT